MNQIDSAGYEPQLRRELAVGHALYGKDLEIVARCQACDDILLEDRESGQRYACRLTWSDQKQNPPYPMTVVYGKAWKRVELDEGSVLVDVEATRAMYAVQDTELYGNCECAICTRLGLHREHLICEGTVDFLRAIGVDPLKPFEVINTSPSESGGEQVELNYHIRGRVEEESVNVNRYGHRCARAKLGEDSLSVSNMTGPTPNVFELRKPWLQAYVWIDTKLINDIGWRSQE